MRWWLRNRVEATATSATAAAVPTRTNTGQIGSACVALAATTSPASVSDRAAASAAYVPVAVHMRSGASIARAQSVILTASPSFAGVNALTIEPIPSRAAACFGQRWAPAAESADRHAPTVHANAPRKATNEHDEPRTARVGEDVQRRDEVVSEQRKRQGAERSGGGGAGQHEREGRAREAHDRAFMTHDEEPCLQLVPKS